MSKSTFIPSARTKDLVVQDVGDETMVYDLLTHKAHCLNKTAAHIWKTCDGETPIALIAERVSQSFRGGVDEDFVMLAITELSERSLLTDGPIQPGMPNRREVLRKISFGIVAAPIIYTLVAPTAMASTSCACVNPGACLTQTSCPSQTNCNGAGVCAP